MSEPLFNEYQNAFKNLLESKNKGFAASKFIIVAKLYTVTTVDMNNTNENFELMENIVQVTDNSIIIYNTNLIRITNLKGVEHQFIAAPISDFTVLSGDPINNCTGMVLEIKL